MIPLHLFLDGEGDVGVPEFVGRDPLIRAA